MGIFQQFPYSNFHEMNLDQIIKIMRQMQDEWEATKTEWASYKDFIDNYFANLDVSEEVLEAMRVMAASGELNDIMDPVIASATTEWLTEHVTPTTPIVDNSLSISGAAADAEVVGISGGFLRYKGALSSNQDISSLAVGIYSATDAVAASIADIPINTGGTLMVFKASASATTSQIYFSSNYNNSEVYFRHGTSNPWYTAEGLNGSLTSSDTFAGTVKVGAYAVNLATAQAISDSPIAASGTLFVFKGTRGSSVCQMYFSSERRIFWRSSVNDSWMSVFGYCGLLTATDTYAGITEAGMYGVTSAVNAQISDAPVAVGGTLIVAKGTPTATRTQIFIANDRSLYWRNASDSWSKAFGYMGSITSSMTFASLTAIGIYSINDSNASAITDSPSSYGGIVIVMKSAASGTPIQLFVSTLGQLYWRYGTNDWCKLSIAARNTYFVNTCVGPKPVDLNGKGMFIFGDSIATDSHGGFTWGSLVASATGATEYNYAVGSAAFKHRDETNLRIIDQINDVPVADWANCDVCFVAAGTNDVNYETSAADLRTAVWNVISAIRTNAPDARIIFITPIQRGDEFYNSKLPRVAGAIANVALENDLDVINGFDFPIPTYSNDWIHEDTDNDGLHPKDKGKRIYAKAVLNAIM